MAHHGDDDGAMAARGWVENLALARQIFDGYCNEKLVGASEQRATLEASVARAQAELQELEARRDAAVRQANALSEGIPLPRLVSRC